MFKAGLQVSKKQNVSSLLTRKYSILWGASVTETVTETELTCSALNRQGSNFESCVSRALSSHSSHHLQEVLLARTSLHVHKGGLKPHSFYFESSHKYNMNQGGLHPNIL